MQVATSQRAHPPPVPPRPSRQVVAEALKRSPRPPCPTRQAPPPPNTRPWRSEDQKVESLSDQGGRTVVYESIKELPNGEHPRSASEPRTVNELPQRSSVLPRSISNDETRIGNSRSNLGVGKTSAVTEKTEERCGRTNRATSERNEAENPRERHEKPPQQQQQQQQQQRQRQHRQAQQPQRRSNDSQLCDWGNNSVAPMIEKDGDIRSRTSGRTWISPDKIALYEESRQIGKGMLERKKDSMEVAGSEKDNKTPKVADSLRTNGDTKNFGEENKKTRLDQFANENIAKSNENVKFTPVSNGDDAGHLGTLSTSFFKKPDERKDSTASPRSPTSTEKKHGVNNGKAVDAFERNEEPIGRLEEVKSAPVAATSDSAATISGDDCTTVVVIDEPERKIAFNEDSDNIHHQDWLEAGVRYSSTKITLPGDEPIDRVDEFQHLDNDDDRNLDDEDADELRAYAELEFARIRERIAMSSLQGLPPLPRSLSGFNLNDGRREAGEPPPPPARSSSKTPKNVKSTQPSSSRPSPPGRQLTTLDTQLAILRKEMFGLRQLDLSLLSQLWSLNESIQEFRQLLQEQEDRAPSPSPSSEEGDDISYSSHPPPPPRRPAPLLHHQRPPRPPRPLRPPASDDSPSSEEYGAV